MVYWFKIFFIFICTNQCGISSDELQHKCPHAVRVNSNQHKEAGSSDAAPVETESDNERSTVESTEDES